MLIFLKADPRPKYHRTDTKTVAIIGKNVGKFYHCAIAQVKGDSNNLH